jgi:hypothetical protein
LSDLSRFKNFGSFEDELISSEEPEQQQEEHDQKFNSKFNYVVFLIQNRLEEFSQANQSCQELIRYELKKNSQLNDIWHIVIVYVGFFFFNNDIIPINA